MSRLFVLFAFASVAAASVMFPLELDLESFRQADPDNVIGSWRQKLIINKLNCSERISHSRTIQPGGPPVIPHSVMRMNSKRCLDNNNMSVFLRASGAKAAVADSAPDGTNVRAVKDLIDDVDSSVDDVIYGVEKKGRICGGSPVVRLGLGTVVMIFVPPELISVGNIPFPDGLRYMIVKEPEENGLCIYSAPLRDPEEPSPSPDIGGTSPPASGSGTTITGPTPTPDEMEPGESPEDLTPTPTEPEEDGGGDDDDDGSVCFPGDATVELEDGSVKTMDQVELGDRVKVGAGLYSDVYMFTHKNGNIKYDFVEITTSSGAQLVATKSHYIYLNGMYAAASSAKVGDTMELGNGDSTTVSGVSVVRRSGLYNPQTLHGDIIVNSMRASTFTRTFEPSVAQGLLSPFRMLYGAFGWSLSFLDNGSDQITAVLPRGQVAL